MLTVAVAERTEPPAVSPGERLFTVEEAADYLRVTRQSIYRFCEEGRLRYLRLGGTGVRRFRRADLDAFLGGYIDPASDKRRD